MSNIVNVQISRAIGKDEDLHDYARRVSSAVRDDHGTFGADQEWDIYVVDVSLSSVVVRDYEKERYVRADYVEENDTFSFSNVKLVKRS